VAASGPGARAAAGLQDPARRDPALCRCAARSRIGKGRDIDRPIGATAPDGGVAPASAGLGVGVSPSMENAVSSRPRSPDGGAGGRGRTAAGGDPERHEGRKKGRPGPEKPNRADQARLGKRILGGQWSQGAGSGRMCVRRRARGVRVKRPFAQCAVTDLTRDVKSTEQIRLHAG
jgi:hypothetical protein